MDNVNYKMESGIQLMARLNKKPEIGSIYPTLFNAGPKCGDIIEVFSNISTSFLITDIICEALIPGKFRVQAGVLVFNVDGHFNTDYFINLLRTKLIRYHNSNTFCKLDPESLLRDTLRNFHIVNIYDVTQLHSTIHNLENILIDHCNISLIIFDTLTAFYWSEQSFKITKMDLYLKNLLLMIQKVTKEHKNIILYTRPEYFNSKNDTMLSHEPCCENSTPERLNYRIQLFNTNNHEGTYLVHVVSFNTDFKRHFKIIDDEIKWLND